MTVVLKVNIFKTVKVLWQQFKNILSSTFRGFQLYTYMDGVCWDEMKKYYR